MKEAMKEALQSLDLEELEFLVKEYQSANSLEIDGWPGEKTTASIARRIERAHRSSESADERVQRRADQRIERARSVVGIGTKYRRGRGGGDPSSITPATNGLCDCSGLAAWLMGLPRQHSYGDESWINTDAMLEDAMGPRALFQVVQPFPGCFVVYGNHHGRDGHVALVTSLDPLTGIDCSSSVSKKTGMAISERDISFFLKKDHAFVVPKV